jgi:hypothetical protein
MRARWIIIGFLLLAVIGGGFLIYLWYQSRAIRGLTLEIAAPNQIKAGAPFDLQINVHNASKTILKDSRLSVEIPEDMVFLGQDPGKILEYKNLGDLGIGSLTQEKFRLMVIKGPQSVKPIKAALSYLPIGLGTRFEKTASFDLAVTDFSLKIDIVMPTKVFGGEDFETVISYRNDSEIDYSDLKLIIDYPPPFNFVKSTLPPDIGNREWNLGDLRRGSANEFKFTGNLIGPANAFFDFNTSISADFGGKSYAISANKATVSIAPSPLSLNVGLNENPEYLARPGDILNYVLTYSNNTDTGLRDAVITAKFSGEMFDFSELETEAVHRLSDHALIWNAANTPELMLLEPGAEGLVRAKLRVKADYPIKRLGDKNFLLNVKAVIESPTVPYFVSAAKTIGLAKLETKVMGRIEVDARGYFRDAASGIVNRGPFPPRLNQPTQFTIHWRAISYAVDASAVEIRSFLGPNVRFTGVAKSNIGSAPIYNERTQEVIWQIDKLPANRGVIGGPAEAIFQVEAVPSQAGNYWTLLQMTSLKSIDEFTGQNVSAQDFEITTLLPDDPTISSGQGIVVQ